MLILSADGGLNADNADQFVDDLERIMEAGVRRLIVDCGRLRYISSYGMRVLIRLHKRLAEKQSDVKLAAVDSVVVRLLELTKLNTIFEIHPTVDDARRTFHGSPQGEGS